MKWNNLSRRTMTSLVVLVSVMSLGSSKAQAQTFGGWSGSSWSGGGHSATVSAGAAGALGSVVNLSYTGSLAAFSPISVKEFQLLGAGAGTVLDVSLSAGLAGGMGLLLDNMAIGGAGYSYRLSAFDATNTPVSLAGVAGAIYDVSNPGFTDKLTLNTATGDFGLSNLAGGDDLNTATTVFTGFDPSVRSLRITALTSPGGDLIRVGIQTASTSAPEPAALALLVLGGAGLLARRRR